MKLFKKLLIKLKVQVKYFLEDLISKKAKKLTKF